MARASSARRSPKAYRRSKPRCANSATPGWVPGCQPRLSSAVDHAGWLRGAGADRRACIDLCRAKMRAQECGLSGRRPEAALVAEFAPGVVSPPPTAVPDFALHREAATAA